MLIVSSTSPKVADLLGFNITTCERRACERWGRKLKNRKRKVNVREINARRYDRWKRELSIGIRYGDWRSECDC